VSETEYKTRINFLEMYFLIINYIEKENNNRNHFRIRCVQLMKIINNLRNFYPHNYHKPIEINEDFFNFLDYILLETVQEGKKHKIKDLHLLLYLLLL